MEAIIRGAAVATHPRVLGRRGDTPLAAALNSSVDVIPEQELDSAAPFAAADAVATETSVGADAERASAEAAAALAYAHALLREAEAIRTQHAAECAAERQRLSVLEEDLVRRERLLEAGQQALKDAQADAFAQASSRGQEEGYARGITDARAAVAAETRDKLALLDALAAGIGQAATSAAEAHEDLLVEIAWVALCRLVGERAAARDGVMQLVAQAVREVGDAAVLRVRVHPDDAAWLQQQPDASRQWTWQADPTVTLGGCIVDSDAGDLDARLELQLDRMRSALTAVRAERRSAT